MPQGQVYPGCVLFSIGSQCHVRKDLYVGTPYVCSHYYTAAAVRTQRRLTGSVCLYWNMYTKRTWPVRCPGQCEVYRVGLNDYVE